MKKLLKIFTSALLALSMLTPALPAFAAESDGMQPLDNLKGLGGSWSFGDPITCNGSGDMFALSDSSAESFIFEADVEFVNRSGAASLVFLSSDNPARGSYVANIDLSAGNARIFRFESAGGATTKGEYKLTAAQKAKSTFHLRVEVSGDSMVYFLDGEPVVSITDSTAKHGTRLGLLTYNTSLKYTNVRWAELSEDIPELTALTGLSTPFSGQNSMKETLPFGTTELKLTATSKNGTLSATAEGATVKISDKNITVSNIKDDFDLVISVAKGAVVRSYVVQVKVEADPSTIYNEEWRAQLHFSTLVNWINDPNGLVYDPSNETWHLFYQYNPYGLNIANQVWGHAVSTDLAHWKELDIAIPQDSLGAVFSGSCVVDENNTTGFFTDSKAGESKLVALYTSDGGDTTHGVEKQCIAYSKDHGVTWIKPDLSIDKNIVISNAGNKYGRDFRDPKIFRYDDKWFMVVAGGRARLFTSDNLIDWTLACDMGFDSECPDFYPLAVDGDENNIKWVYTASGDWYIIGRLEEKENGQYQFVQESERIACNGGGEVYATQSFYNDGSGLNRRIGISWLQDHSASSLDGKTWNGAQSLPHEQTLRTVNGKIILTSYPVAEVNELRGTQVVDLQNATVEAADTALSENPGKAYDLELTFKPEAGSVTTLTLRQGGTNNVQVVYDSAANKLRVVRGRASSATGNIPTGTMEMPLYPDADGNVTIRVVMDTTVIEVFGNEGEAACTGYIFPDADCINSSLSVSGEIEIQSMKLWRMTSIWHAGEEILPESGIYFDASSSVSLSEETTVSAYLINEKGEREDASVTWGDVDAALATVVSKDGGKLVLQGVAEGKLILTATAGNESRKLILSVAETGFETNLEGWTSGGDWYEGESGWTIAGSSGDSFTFSTVTHDGDFTYTGVADFGGQGGCLGLVFGATNPASPKSGTWYGANVDTHSSTVSIKLFCNTNGNETWNEMLTISAADTYTLTVTYADDTLTYTVNGESVSRTVRNLKSGTLGLVSWNGGGSFNQVNYTSGTEVVPPATDDPTVDLPATNDPAVTTESVDPAITTAPTTEAPTTGDDVAASDNGSSLLPILIGVGAVALVGAIAVVVIVKKKKR
ncbi:MAG: glycoside hydrolase family 32 protein [Clostridia bacterium]|nr:glycoside hydrolase family 32 protein [Clostridia bacterium]